MFPAHNKNLQRLQRLRWIIYVVMAVVGFTILGVKTLLAH